MANTVKHLPYKGEKWPIRISYYAIKMFQEETKKDVSEIDKDISLLEVLLWFALIAGHTAEGKPMTLKRDEMQFMLDESLDEFNELMMSFFPEAVGDMGNNKKK